MGMTNTTVLFWLIVCSTLGWFITAVVLAYFVGQAIKMRDNDGPIVRTGKRRRKR